MTGHFFPPGDRNSPRGYTISYTPGASRTSITPKTLIFAQRAWDESSFFYLPVFCFYIEKEDPKDKGPGPGLGVLETVVRVWVGIRLG